MRARSAGIIFTSLLLLASCGSSSQASTSSVAGVPTTTGKVNPTYATFCAASSKLNAAMAGPHGENPAAITDPTQMAASWSKITELSKKLQALSPSSLKNDANKMINGIIAMDKIFQANKYDLLAIAKKPTVRDALTKIATDPSITEASTRFNTFLTHNCGV